MDTYIYSEKSPVESIDCSFRNYLNKRKGKAAEHLINGIPDYSFPLDYEWRKKLDAIPGLYSLGKKIYATIASNFQRQQNMNSLAVGPNQFPEVYKIGCDCAKILGIGIPNIYIESNPDINAFAIACDDMEPVIIINSGLYERMTLGELKAVIGHECGHIHNNHVIYSALAELLLNQGISVGIMSGISNMVYQALTISTRAALETWSRAAEVTCDRAAAICCDDLKDVLTSDAKFLYGGAFGEHTVNMDELERQLEIQLQSLNKYDELLGLYTDAYGNIAQVGSTHPSTLRRIAADKEFEECELLYKWRPDLYSPGKTLRSKEETDARCKKIISVLDKGLGEKR